MKQFSSKKSVQILAYVLKQYGIENVVLSPGSRNAPLAIQFTEDQFTCYSIVDERSAGFVALGMAKSLGKPAAVCSTSGSAAVNYYPAVVEAFYQNVPLLVLTADRPVDFVDIFDGQTIRQKGLFAQHSYGEFELMEDGSAEADQYNLKTAQEAVECCLKNQGPVHINIPLSEPLYETVTELAVWPKIEKEEPEAAFELDSKLVSLWNSTERVMIIVGTMPPSERLSVLLEQLVKNHSVVVMTEANSNQFHDKFFNHIDRYIFNFDEEDIRQYAPELVITLGQNVVSKKIKQFLRKAQLKNHWHVDRIWHPDTFFALTEKIVATPEEFLTELIKKVNLEPQAYYNLWDVRREKVDQAHADYSALTPFSDFMVFSNLPESVPEDYAIHFSNSTAIRYAQLFDFSKKHEVHCNRGTSGIDGSTSTAMGFSIVNKNPVLLITGDLAFFYDINGLWNAYIPPYTRIIVMNNGEGNIFRIIPGPSETNAVDDFIATRHDRNAADLAKAFNFDYFRVDTSDEFLRVMENFFKPSVKAKILEINTKPMDNAAILASYFTALNRKSDEGSK